MSIYKKWASKEYPVVIRILATLTAGSIFAFFIPLFLFIDALKLDQYLTLPNFDFGILNSALGIAAIATGFFFAFWSIIVQLNTGRGTPIPTMATQTLLIRGPFNYSRNPMSFGTILAYVGITIFIGSWSALFLRLFLVH